MENNAEPNVDALAQKAAGEAKPAQQGQQPSLPEGLSQEAFSKAIEGYGFKGPDDLKAAAQARTEYEKLQQQYGQMQAQIQKYEAEKEISPYANPLVERINSFFQEGKDASEVQRFLQLQAIDTENLQYDDAIRQKMRMEYPHLDADEIDAQMEATYGAQPSDDDPDAEKKKAQIRARLKIDGQAAKKWIEEQKVPYENQEAKAKQEAAQQQMLRIKESWSKVANSMASSGSPSLSWGANDAKIGGDYQFDYTPKLDDEGKRQVAQLVADYAVANNLPLTEESLPVLKEYQEAVLWNMHREDYLLHMARDMYAALQERFVSSSKATAPIQRGSDSSRTQAPQSRQAPQAKRGFI